MTNEKVFVLLVLIYLINCLMLVINLEISFKMLTHFFLGTDGGEVVMHRKNIAIYE